MIKAVIFDMDGTLFDTEALHFYGWEQMVKQGLLSADFVNFFQVICGKDRRYVYGELPGFIRNGMSPLEAYAERDRIWRAKLERDGVPLKKGCPEVLLELKEKGFRLALASASMKPVVDEMMERTGLGNLFDIIATGNDIKNGKPAPDIYRFTLRALGITGQEAVAVEDSPVGLTAAVDCGLKAIAVPDLIPIGEDLKPRLWKICGSLLEVPALVEQLNAR